jgi:hypothetical protein
MTLNSNRFKYLAGIIKEDTSSIEEVFTSLDKKNKGIWNPAAEHNVEQEKAKDLSATAKTTVDDENKTRTEMVANEGMFDDDEDSLPSPKEIDALGTESFDDDLGEPNDIHAFLNWDKDEQEPYRQAIDTLMDKGWDDEQIINHLKKKRDASKETGNGQEWFDLTSESKTTEIREAATRFKKLAGLLKEQKFDISPETLSPEREEEEEWLALQGVDTEHSEEDFGGSFLADLEADEDMSLEMPELDEQAEMGEPKVHSIVMNILVSAPDRRTAAQHADKMIRQLAENDAASGDVSGARIIGPGKS